MNDRFGFDTHPCAHPSCNQVVAFDDEPFCFEHSPDSGSHNKGYSYKKSHNIQGEVVTENNSNVTIVVPPKPSPHAEAVREAEIAIQYLNKFTSSSRLDPDLRMAMNDIQNTLKRLKQIVQTQDAAAESNHDKIVELTRAQRLI